MNAPLPQSATSLPIVSALPESWIEKIFSKFEARYGSLFLDRWRDCNMQNVKDTWAEELAGFADQPDRIAYALRALADQTFPPTLPEFIAACRRAPAKPAGIALPHRQTPEQLEENRKRIEEMAGILAKSKRMFA